jgi:hypothetical protein
VITNGDVIEHIVQAVVSGGVALGGVWLGAYLTAGRAKRERATERSLRWHERCAKQMYDVAAILHESILATEDDPEQQLPPELWARYKREVHRLTNITSYSRLYATKETNRRVLELRRAISQAASNIKAANESEPWSRLFGPMIPALISTATSIANEVRSQLLLESLELPSSRSQVGTDSGQVKH